MTSPIFFTTFYCGVPSISSVPEVGRGASLGEKGGSQGSGRTPTALDSDGGAAGGAGRLAVSAAGVGQRVGQTRDRKSVV